MLSSGKLLGKPMTDRQKFEITGKITKEKSEEFHNQLKKISDSITFASTFYEDGYLKLDGECDDGEQVGEVYELVQKYGLFVKYEQHGSLF